MSHMTPLCTPAAALLAAALLFFAPGHALAQDTAARPATPPPPADFDEFTPAWEQSVAKGLAWLAKQQNADGSFGGQSSGYARHVAVTSLAGLAFLAEGSQPNRGQYGEVVAKTLDYLLTHCTTESGLLIGPTTDHGPMYGHGFAALFLAEVYGQSHDPRVREELRKAIRLIVQTQNHEGGWRYQARPMDADISVTICEIMALRAAANSGITVPQETIDRAIKYVKACQQPDGGFSYMLSGGGSAFPRSAAGLASLYYAGIYTGPEIEKAVDYCLKFTPGRNSSNNRNDFGHHFYAVYYATQALFQAGGGAWAKWWPATRDDLIRRQNANGSWQDGVGPEYATAMALISLQIPKRMLPILQN